MLQGLFFAFLAAGSAAGITLLYDAAAKSVSSLVGAIIISATATILGLLFLIPKFSNTDWVLDKRVWLLLITSGIMALCIDYFSIRAFTSNVDVSVVGPIISGGSIFIVASVGVLFLGESLNLLKLVGLISVFIGVVCLSISMSS